jgi:putative transposase
LAEERKRHTEKELEEDEERLKEAKARFKNVVEAGLDIEKQVRERETYLRSLSSMSYWKMQERIPEMIKIMKGGIARKLFLMYPEMKKQLWGGHLWNPSYCVVTVSDRSRDMVEHYIESQKEKKWGGIGRPPKDLEQLQAYHRQVTGNDTSGDDAGK